MIITLGLQKLLFDHLVSHDSWLPWVPLTL
jgi:hypothetical protein